MAHPKNVTLTGAQIVEGGALAHLLKWNVDVPVTDEMISMLAVQKKTNDEDWTILSAVATQYKTQFGAKASDSCIDYQVESGNIYYYRMGGVLKDGTVLWSGDEPLVLGSAPLTTTTKKRKK